MKIFEITLFGATVGPTWYGLMYVLAFAAGWALLAWRGPFSRRQLDDLMFWLFLGVVLGGRLGYVLFYNLPHFLGHPLEILQPWKGGMSFHGGLIGTVAAMALFARREKAAFLRVTDAAAWVAPLGLAFGRVGNYVNGELMGLPGYSGPLAYVGSDGISRFPTPLLEMALEGFALFALTSFAHFYARKNPAAKPGMVSAVFLAGYAAFRFAAEFFRTPDAQVGYLAWGWLTMGQILSLALCGAGLAAITALRKTNR